MGEHKRDTLSIAGDQALNQANMFNSRPVRGVGLMAVLLIASSAAAVGAQEPAAEKIVRLTVDYGDGAQKVFTGLSWKEGATVFTMLQAAARHPRGIKMTHQGSGAATLV